MDFIKFVTESYSNFPKKNDPNLTNKPSSGGGGGQGQGQEAAQPQEEDVLLQAPRPQVRERAHQQRAQEGEALSHEAERAQVQALQRIEEVQQGVRKEEEVRVGTSRCDCLSSQLFKD